MTKDQKEALHELDTKTLKQIQIKTAHKFAFRAWAAQQRSTDPPSPSSQRWLRDAAQYEHCAIEHAALADAPGLLEEVRLIIKSGVK